MHFYLKAKVHKKNVNDSKVRIFSRYYLIEEIKKKRRTKYDREKGEKKGGVALFKIRWYHTIMFLGCITISGSLKILTHA